MPKPKVAILPRRVAQEEYLLRIEEIMAPTMDMCRMPSQSRLLRDRLKGRPRPFEALLLQWIDNAMIDAKGRFSLKGYLRAFVKVAVYRLWARRIVFVRHNQYPHSTHSDDADRVRKAVDRFERHCDASIVHSPAELTSSIPNRVYCPHPLYERIKDRASEDAIPEPLRWTPGYFIAFGRMEPYKRLPELIDQFPEEQRLLVFGAPPRSQALREELERKQRNGVRVHPAFLDNAIIQYVVDRAAGLIVVNADKDMIASGSVVYAISMGLPVYAVETPYLIALQEMLGSEMIHIAPDLPSLMTLIAAADPNGRSKADMARIMKYFGDDVVHNTLSKVLLNHDLA